MMKIRQRKLLCLLLDGDDFLSATLLSKKLEISPRTIYTDLEKISDVLATYNLTLEKIPRHGIRLVGETSDKVRLKNELLESVPVLTYLNEQERIDYILNSILFKNEKIGVVDFSVELFAGETTIRRDLTTLKNNLKRFHLNLVSTKGILEIVGNEKDIRNFIRTYLIEHIQNPTSSFMIDDKFSHIKIESSLNKLRAIANDYGIQISAPYDRYLALDWLIAISRIKLGKILEKHKMGSLEYQTRHLEAYLFASALLKDSFNNIEMLHQEVDWLATSILSTGYETGRDKTETVIELTKKLITEVSRLANFPFTQDTLLYHQLLNHIQPLIHRLKRGISLTNPIVEEVKSRYSILYNFVWLASQKVINSESASINSSEVSLLTLYFQVSVERMEKPLSIAVVCPHGLATSELILSVVRKEISPIDRIEKVELDKIEAVQADYDLIISSILLPFDSKKTVLVSSIPLESELRQLKEIYQSLSHRNQGLFISHVKEPEQFIDITIRELLDGRIHYENLKNQEQAFSFLASKCHELNKSNPDFMKSILEREILGSTGVYTGIALPHASPSVVEKSECHLIILKHPIIWGNTLVKVVLLIAIKENEEEIYRDALIHLFSKVDKEEWIESLSKTSKLDETMKLLLEKNEGGI